MAGIASRVTAGSLTSAGAQTGPPQRAAQPVRVSLGRRRGGKRTGGGGPAAAASSRDLSSLLDELDVPDIGADLSDIQAEAGAVFADDGVPATFGNDRAALEAAERGVAVVDRSHWGRLRLSGAGRAAFLHGQSTADIAALQPGSGCETVLVTAQARCLDLATCYAQRSGLMLVVSPGMAGPVAQRLDKVIFPGDNVEVADVSAKTAMLSLLGPEADAVMRRLQAGDLVGSPAHSHLVCGFRGRPVVAAVGGGLAGPGYTLIADEAVCGDLWRAVAAAGAVPMGSAAWEAARVLAGRPAAGSELTEEYTPLEAGLYHAVSLAKGCYIGQETLAKVHARGALRRQLWGLDLQAPCAAGELVRLAPPPPPLPTAAEAIAASAGQASAGVTTGGEQAAPRRALGEVTSYVDSPSGGRHALAYLRCKVDGEAVELRGARVVVGGVAGRVVELPYATRTFPVGAGGKERGDEGAAQRQRDEEAAAEATRRAEKLRLMQERLAAWQATQGEG